MHLAICAIFRNEAPYLREWIEFHLLAGVQKFHLYQNRSEDDYQSVLRPYIKEGIVELIDWPRVPPAQIQAYQHFVAAHSGKPWWVAFIDCDEFLFSPCYATLSEAIEAVAQPPFGAIGVNWMCFGAGGHEEAAPAPMIERFTLRTADNFPLNRHIKSIVRMDHPVSGMANPHFFHVADGTQSESGATITGALTTMPSHSTLRINHYHTKTRPEYLKRIAHGKADGASRRSPEEFDGYQALEIDDRATWRFLPELKKWLALREQQDRQRQAQAESQAQSGLQATSEPAPHVARAAASQSRALPAEFAAWRNHHEGETMLVCGCGSSLNSIVAPERFPTIGVNDIGRLFHPDYLVVVNPRSQFSGDRFRYVETSQAQAIFTQLELGLSSQNIVRFRLGRRGTDFSDPNALPYTRNSPYIALCLALHMGARRIGLIGVDFTDNHFYSATGRHSLAGEVPQINREYEALAEVCRKRGVEVFNLSAESLVTAFPKITPQQFTRSSLAPASSSLSGSKAFFVNYRFLSCGEVFTDGLNHAAEDLQMQSASAYWDDPNLTAKIEGFSPDLLFIVHGRKYCQRWRPGMHQAAKSAIWLLDEPYEVDDTSRFSPRFDHVFICDPASLDRHRNAYYLPVCYDPALYHYLPGPRAHRVGFIGGANPVRESMLAELACRGLLSYVAGGPWRDEAVRRATLAPNIPATETAKLYRQTQIVVNVFRSVQHFNAQRLPAVSMNPRIYEALACGALVVSERRPEIEQLCPELPVFDTPEEMVALIEGLFNDPARFSATRRACIRRLAGHTYAHRLHTAFTVAGIQRESTQHQLQPIASAPLEVPTVPSAPPAPRAPLPQLVGWELDPTTVEASNDTLLLRSHRTSAPGSEAGMIGLASCTDVSLSFDIHVTSRSITVAKIHQAEARNQFSNSYHLMIDGSNAYIARHGHIFHAFQLAAGNWHSIAFAWNNSTLKLEVDGKLECRHSDSLLPSGYSFIGIKSGQARVRNPRITIPAPEPPPAPPEAPTTPPGPPPFDLLYDNAAELDPIVSIITTVHDRISCLEACIRSVLDLTFDRYEHIIVADAPPTHILARLRSIVENHSDGRRLRLATLRSRANDWGKAPAAAGLSLATGSCVSFLSDDNGYTRSHFEKLVAALDREPGIGFAYSGCLYDGRLTLNGAPPLFGRIDLGQPLFRRELFHMHQATAFPFAGHAWDWKMIEFFLERGVRWKHIPDSTFIFRLAKYPHLAPSRSRPQPAGALVESTTG